MARFYPRAPGLNTPKSERIVREALESLPKSWRVFHSVAWQVPKRSRVFDGEADFVLIHPKHGMVVLEVKGGVLEVRDGTWFQRDVSGGAWRQLRQSPFEQAKSAMYDLLEYLGNHVPGLAGMPATRAVVMPVVSHPGGLGPDMPAEMIIAKDQLADIAGALDSLLRYAKLEADLPTEHVDAITALLAPTVRIQTKIGTELRETDQRLIELTGEQTRVLDLLRRHRRALITGGAGTGKTILAIERARRLAIDGAKVLLTCYNRPLGDHLAEETSDYPGVKAQSFHAFGRHLVGRAGLVVPPNAPPEWFSDDLPEMLPTAAERTETSFDAIVVDEGQDFSPAWFTALQLLLEDPDEGPMYVFADANQAIYVDDWEPPFDDEPFPLDLNCRNTLPIAEKVAAVIGAEPLSMGADGLPPQFIVAESDREVRSVLDQAIGRMLSDEGVRPDQITILCDHRRIVNDLQGSIVGGTTVGALGSNGVVAETIHRFKGLEDDVVFVVLDEVETPQQQALAYIGMSRAKGLLVVVGSASLKAALQW